MMGLERTALPTSWGRIGPECLNLTAMCTARVGGGHRGVTEIVRSLADHVFSKTHGNPAVPSELDTG